MSKFTRLIAIVISLICVILCYIYFARNIANISIDKDLQTIRSSQVLSDISIYKDYNGIPHIIASNDNDLFFAVGYVQAQDRMWQMDFVRRAAEGKLSEVLGEKTVNYDKFMRLIDIENSVKIIYENLDENSKQILIKFSEGVNSYIKNNNDKLSLEFATLDYIPDNWQPYHSLMIGRMMSFELCLSIYGDLAFSALSEKFGIEKARTLIPDYPINAPTIYEMLDTPKNITKNSKIPNLISSKSDLKGFLNLSADIFKAKNIINNGATSNGSNSWVVKSKDSTRKSSLLANDPHLALSLPAKWYQMHITSPNINSIGFTIVGIPLNLIGRNDYIAWGITNTMLDDWDYFYETTDSLQKNYLASDNKFYPFKNIPDSIQVKNKESIKFYKRYANNSAVISDFNIVDESEIAFHNKNKFKLSDRINKIMTFKWIGKYNSNEIKSLYDLNRSTNFKDFEEALYNWGTPALNFTYADKSGNIGCKPAGFYPLRNSNCSQNFINKSSDINSNWSGIGNLANYYQAIYNSREYIATANNKLSKNDNTLSNYWEPSSRIERIYELLNGKDVSYNFRDAQYMQIDYFSKYSQNMLNIIIPILDKYDYLLSKNEKNALYTLRNWDNIMSTRSYQASIFNMFYEKLCYNTFHDDMDNDLYQLYIFISNIPTRKMLELVSENNSQWFDIASSNEIENKNYIIFKSFRDAIVELTSFFHSENVTTWEWGKLHKLTLKHKFSSSQYLKSTVNMNEYGTGGNNTTINNSEWNLQNPFECVIGASCRFIADMNENYIYSSVPGGNSGDPINPNYMNQAMVWLNGGFIKVPFEKGKSKDFNLKTIIKKK